MKRCLIFLGMIGCIVVAAAQQPYKLPPYKQPLYMKPPVKQDPLTLQQAVNIALKNSLDLQLAQNDLEANTLLNTYGYAGGLPLIQATVNDNEQTTNLTQRLNSGEEIKRTGNVSNALQSGLGASIILFNGRKVVATKRRLEQLQQLSDTQLDSMILRVVANVELKYYDVVRQQSLAGTLSQSIAVSQQKLDIVKARKEVGMANDADLFQALVDINAQQQALQTQDLVIRQSKTDLLTLLTLRPDSVIIIKDTVLVDKTISLDSILSRLYTENPRLQAADIQVRINELREREAAALRYPSLSANAGYNFNRTSSSAGNVTFNQNYGPYVGAGLTIPIFNGGIYKKQQQVAAIDTRNAKLLKETYLRDYTAVAVKAWQAYNNNLEQLATAQNTYELSGKLVSLTIQQLQLGQATVIDVKTAQQSFEVAGYQLTNLAYAAKAAEIELKLLANMLSY
ncbi:TolC family protein [Chitinophaga sp. sic0106]|uniref:TolC family protein n=1 Tax=Chitinophaga sp. sic0106 TaxID=2854785 RepID=UPI001C43E632|nr:TolC family protein [Chitinophaga sp. sic0106]MBV7532428.1 TolC family protein [Chitinophaga sp. sic0106]